MPQNDHVVEGDQVLTRTSGLVLVMDTPKGRSSLILASMQLETTCVGICPLFQPV